MIIVYHFHSADVGHDAVKDCLPVFPAWIRDKWSRIKNKDNATGFILGKLLMLYGFRQSGIDFDWNKLASSPSGRPFYGHELDFNISHASEMAVCAFSDHRIGIDIERADRQSNPSLLKNFFTGVEWNTINSARDKNSVLFEYWTKKESLIKADGRGLKVLFSGIHADGDRHLVNGKSYFTRGMNLQPGYHCHIASPVLPVTVQIVRPRWPDLLKII